MIGILGKKIGMSQVFRSDGALEAVTVIKAGPCPVVQIKTEAKDGYSAVQLGFEEKKKSRANKSELGHFDRAKVSPRKIVNEMPLAEGENLKIGDEVTVDIFQVGDFVDVSGTARGMGFQGGVKRWHWAGGPKSHGSMSHRRVGSIGSNTSPGRVFKGKTMPGRMGGGKKTIQNLEVVEIDKGNNLLVVKGPVPGSRGGYLVIKKSFKKKRKDKK